MKFVTTCRLIRNCCNSRDMTAFASICVTQVRIKGLRTVTMLCILWRWNGVLHKIGCITFTKHLYVYAMTGTMPDFSLGAACTTSPFG